LLAGKEKFFRELETGRRVSGNPVSSKFYETFTPPGTQIAGKDGALNGSRFTRMPAWSLGKQKKASNNENCDNC